jgi:large subunit ribosomal protein L27
VRTATKKAGGTVKNKARTRNPKNLGVKLFGGELAFPGQVLARQLKIKYFPGYNVDIGSDKTVYAKTVGFVKHERQVRPKEFNKYQYCL